jgi:hypothetical protein
MSREYAVPNPSSFPPSLSAHMFTCSLKLTSLDFSLLPTATHERSPFNTLMLSISCRAGVAPPLAGAAQAAAGYAVATVRWNAAPPAYASPALFRRLQCASCSTRLLHPRSSADQCYRSIHSYSPRLADLAIRRSVVAPRASRSALRKSAAQARVANDIQSSTGPNPPLIANQAAASFSALHLSPTLVSALGEIGCTAPTPIQSLAIPPLLSGANALIASHTGAGKTLAYLMPIIQQVSRKMKGQVQFANSSNTP